MIVLAAPAEEVSDEPRQALVILEDLGKVAVTETATASGTRRALCPGDACGVDMLARPALVRVGGTLATLTPTAEHYLVNAGEVALTGDEPRAVLEADLVRVVPE